MVIMSLTYRLVILYVQVALLLSIIAVVLGQSSQGNDGYLVRTCDGTNYGIRSFNNSSVAHWLELKERFGNCTHITGNLELTRIQSRRDISFLKTIQYVTGYILIAMNSRLRHIPLINLKIIRGEQLFVPPDESGIPKEDECALCVFANKDTNITITEQRRWLMRELQLPSLTEISRGNVYFRANPQLWYVNTIVWDRIFHNREGQRMIQDRNGFINEIGFQDINRTECPTGGIWGAGPGMCQAVTSIIGKRCPNEWEEFPMIVIPK